MRVKGRFVKRSTEQEARALANSVPPIPETEAAQFVTPDSSTAGDSMDVSRDDDEMPDGAVSSDDDEAGRRRAGSTASDGVDLADIDLTQRDSSVSPGRRGRGRNRVKKQKKGKKTKKSKKE